MNVMGGVGAVPLFSSDFKRMIARLQSGEIGWIDTKGQFTQVSAPQSPEFGDTTFPLPLGFNANDGFWYSVKHSAQTNSGPQEHLDINRLPAGSTSNPEVTASVNLPNDNSTPYRDPEGKWAFLDGRKMCGQSGTLFFGDFHPPFFSPNGGQIFRVDNCGEEGRPIIPPANVGIANLVWKEDGSQVVFKLGNLRNDKLYIVDGNGSGTPREITGPGISAVLDPHAYFYSWI
jgi:hypothetical protein